MANKHTVVFDALANILTTKSESVYKKHIENEELFKTYSSFIILRYLTMSFSESVRNTVLDNYISLERMPPQVQYKWLIHNIPQQRSSFIKYIK